MSFAHLDSAEATDVGRKRQSNEDAVLRLPDNGVFCVADGMGGFEHGEMASRAVTDALIEALSGRHRPDVETVSGLDRTIHLVNEAALNANHLIREYCDEHNATGSGSTMVVLAFAPDDPRRAAVLHAGDSRAYRMRGASLDRLTKDHSLAAAAGVEDTRNLNRMFSAMITRAIGVGKDVSLETNVVDVEADDLFMLCSDGLTSAIDSPSLLDIFVRNRGNGLDSLARALVDAANEAGGPDNISVVLIRVRALPGSPTSPEPDTAEREGEMPSPSGEDLTPDEAHSDEPPAAPLPDTDEPRRSDSDQPLSTSDLECVTPSAGSTPDPDPQPPMSPRSAISGPDYPRSRGKKQMIVAIAIVAAVAATVIAVLWPRIPAAREQTEGSAPVDVEALPDPVTELLIDQAEHLDLEEYDYQPSDPPESEPVLSEAEIENMRKMLPTKIDATLLTGEWGHLEGQIRKWSDLIDNYLGDTGKETVYTRWLTLWQKARDQSINPIESHLTLKEAVFEVCLKAGFALPVEFVDVSWDGDSETVADTYCRAVFGMQKHLIDNVRNLVSTLQTELATARTDPNAAFSDLWFFVADRDLQSLEACKSGFKSITNGLNRLQMWADACGENPVPIASIRMVPSTAIPRILQAVDRHRRLLLRQMEQVPAAVTKWRQNDYAQLAHSLDTIEMMHLKLFGTGRISRDELWRSEENREALEVMFEAMGDVADVIR